MKSKEEIFELILLSDLPLPEKQDVYDYINGLECCGNCEMSRLRGRNKKELDCAIQNTRGLHSKCSCWKGKFK